jgi:hypothetical protein
MTPAEDEDATPTASRIASEGISSHQSISHPPPSKLLEANANH